MVHWSGRVFPCSQLCRLECQDAMQVGDAHTQDLREIFDGPRMHALRERIEAGALEGLCCAHCDKSGTCNLYGDPVRARSGRDECTEKARFRRLELAITDRCNMACLMCSEREASPSSRLPRGGDLPLPVIERCLDAFALAQEPGARGALWLHWIGEPLLHPEIDRVLGRVGSLSASLRLNLVTNGVLLDAERSERLLALPGEHMVSVSLNALSEPVFRQVNRSGDWARVHRNLGHLLDRRAALERQADWTVILTSVVLRENLAEIPRWVSIWRRALQARGLPVQLSRNGAGDQPTQLMLLREVSRRESPSIFRSALGTLGVEDLSPEDRALGPLDSWVLQAPQDRDSLFTVALASLLELDPERASSVRLLLLELLIEQEPSGPARGSRVELVLRELLEHTGWLPRPELDRLGWCLEALSSQECLFLDEPWIQALLRLASAHHSSKPGPLLSFLLRLLLEGCCRDERSALSERTLALLPPTDDLSTLLIRAMATPLVSSSQALHALLEGLARADQEPPWWQVRALRRGLCVRPSLLVPWPEGPTLGEPSDPELGAELGLLRLLLCAPERFDRLLESVAAHGLGPASSRARTLQGLAEVCAIRKDSLPLPATGRSSVARALLEGARDSGPEPSELLAAFHVLNELDPSSAAGRAREILVGCLLPRESALEPWQRAQLRSTIQALVGEPLPRL